MKEITEDTLFRQFKTENNCGKSLVVLNNDNEVEYISAWTVGLVRSFRDKSLNKFRNKALNARLLKDEQMNWYVKFQALNIIDPLKLLQYQAATTGKKLLFSIDVFRKPLIRDYKNLVAGFDHAVLDVLTRMNVIIDDSTSVLDWTIQQHKHITGLPYFFMRIQKSKSKCSPKTRDKALSKRQELYECMKKRSWFLICDESK